MIVIDLHTHSSASDGSLSPGSLLEEAAKLRLSALAITDHDTIDGFGDAEKAAALSGVRFIPGVELQIDWDQESGGEFHLLGLGIDRPSAAFLEALKELGQARKERNLEILERMRELKIEASYEEIEAFSGGHSVGRPHFAAFLQKRHIVKNLEQAFARYLGRGKPLYVPKAAMEFDRAVPLIKESGGITVLAHPMSLFVAFSRLPDLIKDLRERGLEGIEAWHPAAKPGLCRRLEELGKSLGLEVSAGSDFHGEARPDRRLGITSGGRKIDESFMEAIPALRRYFPQGVTSL